MFIVVDDFKGSSNMQGTFLELIVLYVKPWGPTVLLIPMLNILRSESINDPLRLHTDFNPLDFHRILQSDPIPLWTDCETEDEIDYDC